MTEMDLVQPKPAYPAKSAILTRFERESRGRKRISQLCDVFASAVRYHSFMRHVLDPVFLEPA